MKLGTSLYALLLVAYTFGAPSAELDQDTANIIVGQSIKIPELGHRYLQDLDDLDTVRLGDDRATITVTIDQTAANGALTYGEKFVVIRPAVAGGDTKVTCTATMSSSLVNMQFFLRKAIKPDTDENGNAKDFDCGAMNDNDLIGPDVESCTVTNFNDIGDLVVGYVAVLDTAFNTGATYTINFLCERIDPPNKGGGCFSKDSTVEVLGKGVSKMTDLLVGDKIRTGDSYEPIYAFAHLDQKSVAPYLLLYTQDQKDPLEVTEDHLLLVDGMFLPAKEVQVGDRLESVGGKSAVVWKITAKEKAGLYAPLTPSGILVVNGIQTSAYVSLQKGLESTHGNLYLGGTDSRLSFHFLNHIALSPIRVACMGITDAFCATKYINVDSGYPPFVSFWFQLVNWCEQQMVVIQVFLLAGFFAFVGPLFVLESVFGAAAVPALVLGTSLFVIRGFPNKRNCVLQNGPVKTKKN